MGVDNTYCIIFVLGLVLFLAPMEQASAVFFLPPEWTEEELLELFKQKQLLRVELQNEENFDFESYKQEQLFRAEQVRDQILDFKMTGLQNPYHDIKVEVIITYEGNVENDIPKVVQRKHEIFQTIKAEQISLAEKKFQEILGGKTITNFPDDEPRKKIVYAKFKIDNQTGFINRNHDDFQNYKLLQISIAEEFRDGSWKENLWASNPYQNNESVENSPKIKVNEIIQNNLLKREHKEFENLIIEQIFLAENIRNEMLDFRVNPYLDENTDESLGKTNTSIVLSFSDPTYVTDKPEFNIIDRNAKGFEMVKAMELEIAQNTLNKMYSLSNSEEDDVEIIILTNENKKLNNYERDDKGFEFFKNKQIDIAEKKLMEILGQKNIHNSDYLDFEKIKIKYYSNLN